MFSGFPFDVLRLLGVSAVIQTLTAAYCSYKLALLADASRSTAGGEVLLFSPQEQQLWTAWRRRRRFSGVLVKVKRMKAMLTEEKTQSD